MNPEQPPSQQQTQPEQQGPMDDRFVQTMIPTKNKPALLSYYLGVAGLIPFFGIPFAIAALVLGIKGLKQYKANPTPGAQAHAIVGLVLSGIEIVVLLLFIFWVVGSAASA